MDVYGWENDWTLDLKTVEQLLKIGRNTGLERIIYNLLNGWVYGIHGLKWDAKKPMLNVFMAPSFQDALNPAGPMPIQSHKIEGCVNWATLQLDTQSLNLTQRDMMCDFNCSKCQVFWTIAQQALILL